MATKSTVRAANWDLLRSLAMFLVVVTHASGHLGPLGGVPTHGTIVAAAIICDPLFFALSGYFALQPIKRTLGAYYWNKVCTIILPLILYSVLLYFYESAFQEMSLFGYFTYFSMLLGTRWWFIPTLVPCLIAAPFLARGLAAFTRNQRLALVLVLGALFCSGALFTYLQWLFGYLGISSLALLSGLILELVPPSMLSYSPAFFAFFILGGLYRSLAPTFTKKQSALLIGAGLVAWVIDVYFATVNIPRSDPSFFWFFVTLGAMALCDRWVLRSPGVQGVISWIAQRSYSIYLLQTVTLAFCAPLFYEQAIFGDIAAMAAPLRILFWVLYIFASYGLALLIASIVDPLLLKPLQRLLQKLGAKFLNRGGQYLSTCFAEASTASEQEQRNVSPRDGASQASGEEPSSTPTRRKR